MLDDEFERVGVALTGHGRKDRRKHLNAWLFRLNGNPQETEAAYTSRGFGDLWQAIGEARRNGTLPHNPHAHSQAVGEFVPTDADRVAKAEKDRIQEAAEFEYRHYTDRATYDQAAELQDGKCPECRAELADFSHTHYYQGRVLCQVCSPLAPKFGRPA